MRAVVITAERDNIPLPSLYVAATYKTSHPFTDFSNSHRSINCCTNYQRTAGQGCHLGGIEGLVGKLRLERDLRAAEHGGVHQFAHRHEGAGRRCDRKEVDDGGGARQAPPWATSRARTAILRSTEITVDLRELVLVLDDEHDHCVGRARLQRAHEIATGVQHSAGKRSTSRARSCGRCCPRSRP